MTRRGRLYLPALALAALGLSGQVFGQGDCLNETLYPSESVTVANDGTTTLIAGCSYEQEYSHLTGFVAGQDYEIASSSGGYITVREGTYDGAVVAQGLAAVQLTATGSDLFPHWNVDDQCTTLDDCVETTARLLLDCTPAEAAYTILEDCATSTYLIQLDITSTGDGAAVEVAYTVDGTTETIAGQGVGALDLGPYAFGTEVGLVLRHESDTLCDLDMGVIDPFTSCPTLLVCGGDPVLQDYCYANNDDRSWLYTGDGSGSSMLVFTAGSIESCCDNLTIYDGTDDTGTVLFDYENGVDPADLTGITVFALSGNIYMTMTSDGSASCQDGSTTEWEWEVRCMACLLPTANVTMEEDCDLQQFTLVVDVTSTGDGATVDLMATVDGGASTTTPDLGLGEVTLGPWPLGSDIQLDIRHDVNNDCNYVLGTFSDSGTCPLHIECGTEHADELCHGDGLDQRYYYLGTGTFPIALFFNAGSLETCCDEIHVYDGGDVTAPELTPVEGVTGEMTGVFYSSTNPEHRLTLQVITDGSASCQSGGYTMLEWTVSCLDCVPPTAAFDIVQDCANTQYFISVDVTAMGTDPEIQITNDGAAPVVTATAVGTYQVGPFAMGATVNVTLENDANSLCNVYSGPMVNPLCPSTICGWSPAAETYCYDFDENHAWSYQVGGGGTAMTLRFTRGTIENSTYDVLTIYDGDSPNDPVLFVHDTTQAYNLGAAGSAVNNTDLPYYEVNLTSSGPNLYMTLTSDGSVQCTSMDTYDPWEWEVGCVGCSAPTVTYTVLADCPHRSYSTQVEVANIPSAGVEIENSVTGDTQTATAAGAFTFGPYDVDDFAVMHVTSLADAQCTMSSDSLVQTSDECVIRSCGFDNYEHCYGNDEDRWYTFESLENVPTTVRFLQGLMPAGDRVVLYNGYDETAAVIYQGNNGGNLAGFAVNSQNANNVITLRIQSNGAGSCADGQVGLPLNWDVACGAVGIDETGSTVFAIYPNPTTGLLNIDLGNEQYGNVQVRVVDMSGRTVIDLPLNAKGGAVNTIDMNGLMNGQYMLQLITDKWVKTQRVQLTR